MDEDGGVLREEQLLNYGAKLSVEVLSIFVGNRDRRLKRDQSAHHERVGLLLGQLVLDCGKELVEVLKAHFAVGCQEQRAVAVN